MAQVGRFTGPFLDRLGNVFVGATVNLYREGATVNGAQSGTTPLAITVRNAGKIQTGDTIFVNTLVGTSYAAVRTSETVITVSGFAGTLVLSNGDRLVPSNAQPTLYSDDQAGATTSQPLTTDANGDVSVWTTCGVYDVLLSGTGVVPSRLFSGIPVVGESTISADSANTLRLVDGRAYPLTVIGVQTALDEVESTGGLVYIPTNANILIAVTSIKIPNRVALWGIGSPTPGNPTFRADNSTNANAILQNKTQDGTGQFTGLRNIQIDGGGKAASGTISKAALWFKQALSSSYIKDCRVVNVPAKGVLLEGITTTAQGPYYSENLVIANCNDDCLVVNEAGRNMVFTFLEIDNPGTGKACVRLVATAGSSGQSIGIQIRGLYTESASDATANVLVVDSCANVHIDGMTSVTPSGTIPTTPIIIKGFGNFAGGSSGFTLRNAYIQQDGPNGILIDDQTCGVQVKTGPSGAQPFRFIDWYSSPVAVGTNGIQSQGQIVGVQYQKFGPSLTAASTLVLHEGNFFLLTGNTNVDNIAGFGTCDAGRVVILKTSGTPTFNHNSGGTGNLRLVGSANVAMTANDIIQFVCDGTLWWQCAPVVVI